MECSICLLPLKKNKMITDCFHQFHKKCFTKWIKINNSCPICRTTDFKILKNAKQTVYRCNDSGKLHHTNKPSIQNNELEIWYKNGQRHRINGPAFKNKNTEMWYKNGKLHRDGDSPAYISLKKIGWYKEGKLHRINKPAFINGPIEYWAENGTMTSFAF
ncbi:Ring finger domain [seawater metagenome]|uniref:Ring finger domain n=1 Tax=seawater metagenome TaxID=1561972 RepID=A0A5E8CHE4_9ZZZZ